MVNALSQMHKMNKGLLDTILGTNYTEDSHKTHATRFLSTQNLYSAYTILTPPNLPFLNSSQQIAVKAALHNQLTLIQGPPGTGKTVTCAAVVYNLVKQFKGKVLVVSNSNTAIDHLAVKIHHSALKVIRIVSKRRENCSDELEFLSLHMQAKILLKEEKKRGKTKRSTKNTAELSEDSNTENQYSVKDTFNANKDRKKSKTAHLESNSDDDALKYKMMRKILDNADVICCTCVTSGQKILKKYDIPYVLIDEAVQCTEPLSIIPLAYGCRKLILVGDHKQLGPIILDKKAAKAGLKETLFERLIKLGNLPFLLNMQYRMHPKLAEWPSNTFYEGSLKNGISESKRLNRTVLPFPTFFYVCYGLEELSASGTSYLNQTEALVTEEIIKSLVKSGISEKQIGVITPYEGQRVFILNRLTKTSLKLENLEIKNVDAYQGREKDYIIISLVRSNQKQGIGFLNDERRLNVTLTRAKYGCCIIGNPNTLYKNKMWANFINFYQDRDMIYKGSVECLEKAIVVKKSPMVDLRALFDKIQL
ncbi:hypothetical protein EDEG_01257 [Edhazardia aedis USNM 41457]|uniref:AAA+ ATPase domain-containing protein n=1 Tax=Edhazardia aedis (strain USNM 41457) TaxID=1003232 RepID=J9DAJ4_EDHAE|nr:hypothetical protein EDEG_01257 [Edhazardia aedis USNM 41457]|eukprot:EJW04529.1 hypothetical protein EDEG_01257 [Edhazardia aedis USNM 41457]